MKRTKEYWENRPEVYQMIYDDFVNEYNECMNIAKIKESNGHLDPHSSNYISMTEEEIRLHETDWKAFSRKRGFSEYDIAEYARWHKLSGQTDKLEYAINDPWRRTYSNWESNLYIKHINRAISLGIEAPKEVLIAYEMVKKELEESMLYSRPVITTKDQTTNVYRDDLTTDFCEDNWEDTKPKAM